MTAGQINVLFGWCWLGIGLVFGLIMGLRAEGENWLGGYASLKRRYLRLAHVAFIALSTINILFGKELASIALSGSVKDIGSALMIFGAAGVPITCISAAFFRKIKYFLPLPASAVLVGVVIIVVGLV